MNKQTLVGLFFIAMFLITGCSTVETVAPTSTETPLPTATETVAPTSTETPLSTATETVAPTEVSFDIQSQSVFLMQNLGWGTYIISCGEAVTLFHLNDEECAFGYNPYRLGPEIAKVPWDSVGGYLYQLVNNSSEQFLGYCVGENVGIQDFYIPQEYIANSNFRVVYIYPIFEKDMEIISQNIQSLEYFGLSCDQ